MIDDDHPHIDYDNLPPTPTCLVPYAHQIGGHGTGHSDSSQDYRLLLHPPTNTIFKPLQNGSRGLREAEFYLRVFAADAPPSLVDLRPFLPTFHGLYRSSARVVYLALEDVLACLQNPSVCDLKMGTAACPPDVDAAKIRSENAKYAHRATVGFLLTGMKVYHEESGEYLSVPRYFGRCLDLDAVYSSGIRVFLGPNVARHPDLARAFLARLQHMRKLLSNQCFALYCSSLLLAYSSSRLPTAPNVKTVVKLVDFAHYRSKLESQDVSGFSHGLDTLIRLLDEASCDSSQLCDPSPLSIV
ncbi:unnamed protein product [Schistocephalus solidus]|uniref:Kinase n=1 Tax=Schistocephalus solidus TaxID=70667 RepID=A0A183T352_SCHSO|nr:unnamed protein product [Schistocephalus solidus]